MHKTTVRFDTPCTLDWKTMTPADGGRFCGDCKKVVRDLSSMSERDARALLSTAGGGGLCVRFVYDRHGKILFAADGTRLVPSSALSRARRVAAIAAAAAMPLAISACGLVEDAITPDARAASLAAEASPSPAPLPQAERSARSASDPDSEEAAEPYGSAMGGISASEVEAMNAPPEDQDAGAAPAPAADGGAPHQ